MTKKLNYENEYFKYKDIHINNFINDKYKNEIRFFQNENENLYFSNKELKYFLD